MKKSIKLLVVLITLFGCTERNYIVEPDINTSANTGTYEFINLPAPQRNSLYKFHQASKTIKNSEGGQITINDEYTTVDGSIVKVFASIDFPVGAFIGSPDLTYDISMTLDDETTSETFSPHMVFNKFPVYHVKYEGLDLSNVSTDNIKFLYRGEDGSVEELEYDPISVDKSTGTIEVKNVKLPHFSKFGFTN